MLDEQLDRHTRLNISTLRQWVGWIDQIKSVKDSQKFIVEFGKLSGFQYGIWHDDKLAGRIGVYFMDFDTRKATIGYLLGGKYQGNGLMTRSLLATLD